MRVSLTRSGGCTGPTIHILNQQKSLYEFYESKMGVFGVNPPEIFNSKVQTNLDV